MITTLSTLREKMLATVNVPSQSHPLINQQILHHETVDQVTLSQVTQNHSVQSGRDSAVSVDLSVSHDVFTAVDNFYNLGRSGRFDSFHSLSPEDKEQFVKIVAELAKSGYVGFEELVVNKKVERHDISSQIGDQRLRSARVYDNSKEPHR